MKNYKWNVWSVILVVLGVIVGLRVLSWAFSLLWVVGSIIFKVLFWVAIVLLLVYAIQYLYKKVTGK